MNTDDEKNVTAIAEDLEQQTKEHSAQDLKAFIVFMNPKGEADAALKKDLEKLAGDKKLHNVALLYVNGPKDPAVGGYEINPDSKVKNTVLVYKNKTVSANFVNLVADKQGLESLNSAIKSVTQ